MIILRRVLSFANNSDIDMMIVVDAGFAKTQTEFRPRVVIAVGD